MPQTSFYARFRYALAQAEGRFFVTLIASFFIFASLLLTAILLVDPHEDFGTGIIAPIVLTNRTEKLELLDALPEKPEILVMGSSRVFTMDPEQITTLTDKSAFNASVSYGRPEDHLAILKFLIEERQVIPERLVIGFNAGAFNNDPIDPQLLNNKHLKKYLADPAPPLIQRLPRTLKDKVNASYIRDIGRSIFFSATSMPTDRVSFFANGMQDTLFVPYDEAKILDNYYRALALFEGLNEPNWDRLEAFRALVRYSMDHSIEIDVVLMPMPHITRSQLEVDTNITAIEDALREFFTDQMPSSVTFHDFATTDAFGGDEQNFRDPTHAGIANMRMITTSIFEAL